MRLKNIVLTFIAALLLAGGYAAAQEVNLAALIPDMGSTDLAKQQQSQQEWQKICMTAGTPGKADMRAEVNKQAVEQLGKDLPVTTKAWLLHEIAWTGDASVVPTLAALLNDPEVRIRDGAAMALATITAPEASAALEKALASEKDAANKKRIEDAVAFKKTNLKVGVESQMPQALPYVSDADVRKWLAGFGKLSADDQCRTLASLTVRGDKEYRKFALDAIKSDNAQLKRAGILALEKLGTADDVPLLINSLGFDGGLVMQVASRIADDKFDDAVLKALLAEKDDARFESLGRILADRNVTAACKVLLDEAKKDDCPNKLGYLQIAANVASKANVGDMVAVLLSINSGDFLRDRDRAETIIAGVCKGDAEPVLVGRERVPRVLFSLLGRIGGDKPREIINANLKSNDTAVRDAALKGLCNWPNATVADDLLGVVKNNSMPGGARIQALRAYVRVITLPDDQIGIEISAEKKLECLKNAMALAPRVEEKRLIIDRASAVRLPATVTFVMQYIDNAELAQNVCRTVADLAHHNELRKSDKAVFGAAMDKVLEVSTDNGVKDRVRRYRGDM